MVKNVESIVGKNIQLSAKEGISYSRLDGNYLMVKEKDRIERYDGVSTLSDFSWKDANFPWNKRL